MSEPAVLTNRSPRMGRGYFNKSPPRFVQQMGSRRVEIPKTNDPLNVQRGEQPGSTKACAESPDSNLELNGIDPAVKALAVRTAVAALESVCFRTRHTECIGLPARAHQPPTPLAAPGHRRDSSTGWEVTRTRGQLYIAKGGAHRNELHSAPRTLAAWPPSLGTTDLGSEAAVVGVDICGLDMYLCIGLRPMAAVACDDCEPRT